MCMCLFLIVEEQVRHPDLVKQFAVYFQYWDVFEDTAVFWELDSWILPGLSQVDVNWKVLKIYNREVVNTFKNGIGAIITG